MAPSPTPSQNSLEKVKFSPLPTTDLEEATATTTTTTNTIAAAATTPSTPTTTTPPSPPPSPPSPPPPSTDKQQQKKQGPPAATVIIENPLDQEIARLRQLPSPPAPPADALGLDENKRWTRFLRVLFFVIVVLVVLVLISSVVAITVVNVTHNLSGSSDSVYGFNVTTESPPPVTAPTTFPTSSTPYPECNPTEFQCSNGQCLPSSARCDKSFDCVDLGDEANCTACDGFVCEKTRVCLWDAGYRRCDGVFDCGDLSDEMGCRLSFRLHRLCNNGVRVLRTAWCDGIDDCWDNSDEENCGAVCQSHEVPCARSKGPCIPKASRCDGYLDCDDGTDEDGCDNVCSKNDFQCTDLSCIPGKYRCDGEANCPGDGQEDEKGCVDVQPVTNTVRILSNTSWIPVCSYGWTRQQSADLCQGNSRVDFWLAEEMTSNLYAVLKGAGVKAMSGSFDISPTCKTGKIVTVKCATCGEGKLPAMRNAIAGGELSSLGKWPWVASLAYRAKPICGAVIIDRNWALTALHCVIKHYSNNGSEPSKPPHHFTITFGSTTSTSAQSSAIRHVTGIHPHPEHTVLPHGGITYDLALLKLSSPLEYSDTAQPVCLPQQDQEFSPLSVCFLAGWGLLTDKQHLKPSELRDTRLRVWTESQCQTQTEPGETTVNTNATLCAGYYFGLPSGCQGDSGGPLMCLANPRHSQPGSIPRWSVAGILSRTSSLCGKYQPNSRANRFARVSPSTHWIQEVMETDSIPRGQNIV